MLILLDLPASVSSSDVLEDDFVLGHFLNPTDVTDLTPQKVQLPGSSFQVRSGLEFGICDLFGIWNLGFGTSGLRPAIWNFSESAVSGLFSAVRSLPSMLQYD